MARAGERALAYLEQRTQLGVKFGLRTIRALLREMEHPERAYPTVLIAGTNGKGSVVAYLDAALRGAGLRVGAYTSPHLVRVHERIAVGGRPLGDRALDAAVLGVRDAATRLLARGRIRAHPTHFETLTAAAFSHFRREGVDVALLEVGLGGRLDATNTADPVVSAIVSIARDHEAFLGTSLAAIAREKAGVLRRGRVSVLGPLRPAARRAIGSRARVVGARCLDARRGVRITAHRDGTLSVRTPAHRWPALRPLPGPRQADNLLVALRVLEQLRETGLGVDLERAAAGLDDARWPGRYQWVDGSPPLLLDGAHNPEAARALAEALRVERRAHVLLFAAMADKDVEGMASALFPLAREVVLTSVQVPRAASPDDLASRVGALAPRARREVDPVHALALARGLARPGECVVAAGSLYLVGAVLASLANGFTQSPLRR